jgi:phosphatidylserine decarboxylase
MAECSGVSNSVIPGEKVKKGDHIGNFLFGGSSYVMLFQKGVKLTFTDGLYSCD